MGRRVSVCRVSAIIHWSGCQGHCREKRSNKTLGFSRYLHRENLLAWYSHDFSYDVHMKRWSHENYACKFSLCTWNWMKTLNIYFCFGCQGHWWKKQRSKLIKTLYFLFMEYNSACKNILFCYWCLHTLYHLDWWFSKIHCMISIYENDILLSLVNRILSPISVCILFYFCKQTPVLHLLVICTVCNIL